MNLNGLKGHQISAPQTEASAPYDPFLVFPPGIPADRIPIPPPTATQDNWPTDERFHESIRDTISESATQIDHLTRNVLIQREILRRMLNLNEFQMRAHESEVTDYLTKRKEEQKGVTREEFGLLISQLSPILALAQQVQQAQAGNPEVEGAAPQEIPEETMDDLEDDDEDDDDEVYRLKKPETIDGPMPDDYKHLQLVKVDKGWRAVYQSVNDPYTRSILLKKSSKQAALKKMAETLGVDQDLIEVQM